MGDDQVAELLGQYDEDGVGVLDFDEFRKLMIDQLLKSSYKQK